MPTTGQACYFGRISRPWGREEEDPLNGEDAAESPGRLGSLEFAGRVL